MSASQLSAVPRPRRACHTWPPAAAAQPLRPSPTTSPTDPMPRQLNQRLAAGHRVSRRWCRRGPPSQKARGRGWAKHRGDTYTQPRPYWRRGEGVRHAACATPPGSGAPSSPPAARPCLSLQDHCLLFIIHESVPPAPAATHTFAYSLSTPSHTLSPHLLILSLHTFSYSLSTPSHTLSRTRQSAQLAQSPQPRIGR
jgi:hypothetical protein